jgi:hypothetical protein
MDALLAFAAALVALRLAGRLASRWRVVRRPELAAWSVSLLAFAIASGALAAGAAAGFGEISFRVYYLCGAMLTAPLLGLGSLLLRKVRWALPVALVYCGVCVGTMLSEPLLATPAGQEIPEAQAYLDVFPCRVLAIAGNAAGTVAVIAIALATIRRRPRGNSLIVAGVAVAAAGSALFGVGVAGSAVSLALATLLLYGGFVART